MKDKFIMTKKDLGRKSIFDLVRPGQITQQEASKHLPLSYTDLPSDIKEK